MTAIDYSSATAIVNEGTHRVYAKAAWADAWAEVENLKCEECRWAAAPDINSAILRWDLGQVILPGDSAATTFGPWVGRGQFIRVEWVCDDASLLQWVGFVDSSGWTIDAQGRQTIVCYGIEQSLAKTPMADIVWRDETGGSGVARRSACPVAFNSPTGMRSVDPVTSGQTDYAFAAPNEVGPKEWSTKEIVRYLLAYHLPTNNHGVANIPWAIDQESLLPDWDAPKIETLGRTVADILTELLSPRRQLGYTVGSNGTTAYLRVFTHLASTLTIGSHSLAENPNRHTLTLSPDPLTNGDFSDVAGGCDQLIVRGARRKTICTLRFDDDHFEETWTTSVQSLYELGDSVAADYSIADEKEKRRRNAQTRGRPLFDAVFRKWKLHSNFDFTLDSTELFPGNPNPRTVRILDRLPIKEGEEWDGAIETDDFDRSGDGQPIAVYWPDPTGTATLVANSALDALSEDLADQLELSFAVRPQAKDRELWLTVDGAPQHVIAKDEFTKLPPDSTPVLKFAQAVVTCALEEDRYCEGIYPESAATADVVRRLVVDLGESYQQVRIHADTVADLTNFTGTEVKATGGDLVDDSPKLQALAEIIAKSLLLTRKTVRWESARKISTVAVGDLIETAEGQSVIAPVTSVSIKATTSENRPPKASMQSFSVYRGEQDPLELIKQLGGDAQNLTSTRTETGINRGTRGRRIAALKESRRSRRP